MNELFNAKDKFFEPLNPNNRTENTLPSVDDFEGLFKKLYDLDISELEEFYPNEVDKIYDGLNLIEKGIDELKAKL